MSKHILSVGLSEERVEYLKWFSYLYAEFKASSNPVERAYASLIETSVREATKHHPGLYAYALSGMTDKAKSYRELYIDGIPCGSKMYWKIKRSYFTALNAGINKKRT